MNAEKVQTKNSKGLVALVIVLVCLVISLTGYIVYDKLIANDDKNVTTQENSDKEETTEAILNKVTLKEAKKDGEKMVEVFEVAINDKKKEIKVEFTSKEDEYTQIIEGTFGSDTVYYHNSDEKVSFSVDYVKKALNESSFGFIEGEDGKSYLTLLAPEIQPAGGPVVYLYIYNDELKLVEGDVKYIDDTSKKAFVAYFGQTNFFINDKDEEKLYDDTFGMSHITGENKAILKIENNKLYYYKHKKVDRSEHGVIEEREYTLSNSKLTYKVLGTYNVVSGAGAWW